MKPVTQPLVAAPLILRAGGVVARVRPWAFEPTVAHLVLYNQSRLPTPSDITGWIRELRLAGFDTHPHRCARDASWCPISTARVRGHPESGAARTHGDQLGCRYLVRRHVQRGASEGRRRQRREPGRCRRVRSRMVHRSCRDRRRPRGHSAPPCSLRASRTTRSSPTPSPVVTAGTDTSNAWRSHPPINSRATVRSWSATRCAGWRSWRVQRALVNTHIGNEAALALYHRFGFTDLNDRLHVYERRIE